MRSSFIFGNQGRPSLSRTVCNRTPYSHKNPTRSWFKHIVDLPYGGWGFYARLHCHTYLELSPVFNYAVWDASGVTAGARYEPFKLAA